MCFFDVGRISQFEFSITDAEYFFLNRKLIKKNWGTFSKIGELLDSEMFPNFEKVPQSFKKFPNI